MFVPQEEMAGGEWQPTKPRLLTWNEYLKELGREVAVAAIYITAIVICIAFWFAVGKLFIEMSWHLFWCLAALLYGLTALLIVVDAVVDIFGRLYFAAPPHL